jgi:hypothetical protein
MKMDDPLKRNKGEPLASALFDAKAIEQIKNAIGPQKWHAQYMQDPVPEEEDGPTLVFPPDLVAMIKKSPYPPFEQRDGHTIPGNGINYVGLDIGKRYSHFAVVICEKIILDEPDDFELHIIHLKKYPLGSNIRRIIKELNELSFDPRFGQFAPIFVMDRSGSGGDLCLEIMQEQRMAPIIALNITSRGKSKKKSVLKQDLIENLVSMITDNRLRVPSGLTNEKILFDEFASYHAEPSPKAQSITYRSHGDATDDLLDALALIAYAAEKRWEPRWTREPIGLTSESQKRRRPTSGNRGDYSSNLSRSTYALTYRDYAELRGW